MTGQTGQHLHVAVAGPADRPRALWLVFQDEPEDVRAGLVHASIQSVRTDPQAMDGLIAAHRGPLLVGATWGQVTAGRSALLWPPRLLAEEPLDTAAHLLRQVDAYLKSRDVQLCQSLLRPDADNDRQQLTSAGFWQAADLTYLTSSCQPAPPRSLSLTLSFEAYAISQRQRLQSIIEQTYQQTLDCPKLNGARSMDDVLCGYEQTGSFSAERWFFVRHADRDVGCLLLADHPQHNHWELVYMGLVESARGNRWGIQMVEFAQQLTARAGRSRLVLAVDASNTPALNAYRQCGFQAVCQRRVLLKAGPSLRLPAGD